MTPLTYPVRVTEVEPGEYLARFEHVPEALTSGATYDEAVAQAADALAVALEGYVVRELALPPSRPAGDGEVDVPLDPVVAARGLLVEAMRRENLSKVGLAQRMGKDEKVARRVLTGKGVSLDLIFEALRAVGVRPALAV